MIILIIFPTASIAGNTGLPRTSCVHSTEWTRKMTRLIFNATPINPSNLCNKSLPRQQMDKEHLLDFIS